MRIQNLKPYRDFFTVLTSQMRTDLKTYRDLFTVPTSQMWTQNLTIYRDIFSSYPLSPQYDQLHCSWGFQGGLFSNLVSRRPTHSELYEWWTFRSNLLLVFSAEHLLSRVVLQRCWITKDSLPFQIKTTKIKKTFICVKRPFVWGEE